MAYDNTNSGALFKAKERATDKHPEYTGSINVDGREYWMAGWVNASKSGQKYISLKVTLKEEKRAEKPGSIEDLEDDLPF